MGVLFVYPTVSAGGGGGGADSAITTLTVTNASSSAKTDEIVTFGIPTAPDAIASGQVLRLYDDNGAGAKGTVLDFQIDGESADLNSKQRMARISAVIPSLGANATRKLFLESSSSAVPTGTAITASDILATAFRLVVNYDIGGTVYSFDTDSALAAAETFSKTDYQCVEVYSGPLTTEYLVSGPPKNAGSAHASGDGLRTYISIRAFKAGTGAVASNPITLVQADVWTENGAVGRVSPAHYYYGFEIQRSTSLADGTLISTDDTDADANVIRYSYPRSQPAATLTATGATSTGSKTWTTSGTWDADILGAHIVAGSGGAVVTARGSSTSISVYVYSAFAATSFTSGNWTIEGIGHHYNVTAPRRRVWVGAKPTNVVAWGDNSSAITATDRAPLDYLASTEVCMNLGLAFADVTHSTTKIDLMKSSDGSRRPLMFRGPNGTDMGEVGTHIGTTGSAPTIGPMPRWCMEALAKNSVDGRRRVFENAEYFSTWQYPLPRLVSGTPTNGDLGVWPRADNGTDYAWNTAFSGTTDLLKPSSTWWPYDSDNAHHAASAYLPYLLTGDLYWLTALQRQETYVAWASTNPGFDGAGANRTAYGDATGALSTHMGTLQTRAKAWSFRDLLYATICTPDSISAKVVNAKAYLTTRVGKHWAAAKAYGPDDALGFHSGLDEAPQWCKENRDVGGLTALGDPKTNMESPWMLSFNRVIGGIAGELGLENTDGTAFRTWLAKGARDMCANTNSIARNYMSGGYWLYLHVDTLTGFTDRPADWEAVYKTSCLLGPVTNGGYGFKRTPTGTITLSDATVGTARTMTFASDYFSNGGSTFYATGYVYDSVQGGIFKITAVSADGLTLTGDVTTAFGGTSLTAANIYIPGPHRLDDTGADPLITSDSPDYVQYLVCGARLDKDAGILASDMDAVVAYCTSRSAYVEIDPAFNITERSA